MSASKKEIINQISTDTGISAQDVSKVVEGFLGKIQSSLSEGRDVSLRNFGVFKVKTRSARLGKNPQTGEAIQIAEKKVASFKPSKQLGID